MLNLKLYEAIQICFENKEKDIANYQYLLHYVCILVTDYTSIVVVSEESEYFFVK